MLNNLIAIITSELADPLDKSRAREFADARIIFAGVAKDLGFLIPKSRRSLGRRGR